MSYEDDAKEFGLHLKQGGWRLGLLVARNVEKHPPGPKSRDRSNRNDLKVSASEFAEKSRTSAARVLRYLDAWDRAAAAGVVPVSALLVPGEELDGLAVDDLPNWGDHYDATGSHNMPKDKLPAYEEAAEEAGVSAGAVIRAGKNKAAIAAAIKADPAVALAARDAIAERDRRQKKSADPHGKQDAPMTQLVNLQIQLRSAKRTLTEALGHVIDLRGITDTDEVRASVAGYVQQLRHVLDLIDEAAQGRSLDDELAELLEDEELR